MIFAAILKLGFDRVMEVAYGADCDTLLLAETYRSKQGEFLGTSCCPSWVMTARSLYPELAEQIADPLLAFLDRFLEGLASLRSFRNVIMIFFTSVLIWLLETVKYWFVMHAFNFEVSFFALMLMNGVVNLATTLPSAPGYVGTFDAPGIAVLQLYGVRGAVATAYTLVLHAALWLPITLLGIYYMIREGMGWSDFGRATEMRQGEAVS